MAEPIAEQLKRDMVCEGLLECFHGLKALDREVYQVLVEAEGPMSIDEVAARVDRERSTAYRSIERLRRTGVVQKEQVNYPDGGYYHVYHPTDPAEVADEMRRMLNEWYAKMGQLIQEYLDKYEAEAATPPGGDVAP